MAHPPMSEHTPNNSANFSGMTTPILIADNVPTVSGNPASTDGLATLSTVAGGSPAAIAIEIQSTSGGALMPRLTEAQRDFQDGFWLDGTIIYNLTDDQFQFYQAGTWIAIGVGGGDVMGPGVSIVGDIATWNNITGTLLQDSGVNIADIVPIVGTSTFPLGLQLSGLETLTFNDLFGIVGVQDPLFDFFGVFTVQSSNAGNAVRNVVFIGDNGLESTGIPTSPSALIELQSNNGALLHARMTNAEMLSLIAINGMQVYQTDSQVGFPAGFYFYQNFVWTQFDTGGGTGLTGYDNGTGALFIGKFSGPSTPPTAPNNITAGVSALHNTTTGTQNIAIGQFALFDNTIGGDNTVLGYRAALGCLGNSNVVVGTNAMPRNSAVNNCVVIGSNALSNNTASDMIAIGFQSMFSLTGIGVGQLPNIAIGSQAMYYFTLPTSENIAIGYQAMRGPVAGANSAGFNTAVGHQSMFGITSGTNNVALGGTTLFHNSTGSSNTAIGYGSMQANTTGIQNTAVSTASLAGNVNGSNNTAIGYEASVSQTNASNNTAVGSMCLLNNNSSNWSAVGYLNSSNNTIGSRGTSMGASTLLANTSGSDIVAFGYNTLAATQTGDRLLAIGNNALALCNGISDLFAIGYNALNANTTGTFNLAIGNYALAANTIGNFNVAIGHKALFNSNTDISSTANNNIAIGYESLLSNVGGARNVSIGTGALGQNIDGNDNIAIGEGSLVSLNTISNENIAIGTASLGFLTSGNNNLAIGYNAIAALTTGSGNMAFGTNALLLLTTGSNNFALGENVLDAIVTGSGNGGLGFGALASLTTGSQNVGVGFNTLTALITGMANIGVGYQSGQAMQYGNNNMALGYQALNDAIGTALLPITDNLVVGYQSLSILTSGNSNVCLGNQTGISGFGPITTMNNSTFIGHQAQPIANNLTNATAIGFGSRVAQSNSLVLGGFGPSLVNVGIGNSAPAARLHVAGGVIVNQITVATLYTILSTDYYVFAPTSAAPATPFSVTLPNPVVPGGGQTFVVKDSAGNAALNNITIGAGGILIDGVATAVISTNYGSLTFVSDGTNYFIV